MMTFVILGAAFLAAVLTLFSGFGLGTILMPVLALFLPLVFAVAMTAVVHLLSNLFKLALLWRNVNWPVVWRFGIPALAATVPGACLLTHLSALPGLHAYTFMGAEAVITPVKVIVGLLLIVFVTLEWMPVLQYMNLSSLSLPIGGVLSGFFGGLSGISRCLSQRLSYPNWSGYQSICRNQCGDCRSCRYNAPRRLWRKYFIPHRTDGHGAPGLRHSRCICRCGGRNDKPSKITMGFIQKLVAGMLYVLGILRVLGLLCTTIKFPKLSDTL